MAEDHRLSKVNILIQQQKYKEAENILADLLAEDPNDIHFLSLLAEVHFQQDNYSTANSIINHAIGLAPDEPHLFYIKSRIAIHEDMLGEAEKNIDQAIELDPYDADYFALLAHIKLIRKQYGLALEKANQALEIDAENILALNTRSTALNKLDRKDESFETIEGALKNDPTNTYTHANYGWGLLEKGDHKKALDHFKESLANNPNNEYAQAGMLEAIKATNPIYRLFLKYSFWMSNMTSKYQWGVILGFFIGFRALRMVARNNPNLQPYLMPLIIALAVIAFSTWIIEPVSNLFLRFNKYGQMLLSKKEKMSSNFVALSAAISITGLILWLALPDEKMLTVMAFGFIMMLPLGSIFSPSKNKYALLIYAVALAVVGIIAIVQTFSSGILINSMSAVFFFGFIAYQWIANYMLIKEDNR